MSFASIPRRGRLNAKDTGRTALVTVLAVCLSAWMARNGFDSTHALAGHVAPVALGLLATWLFLSERYEVTLAALMLYLGLMDGVVKLTSGSSLGTLGRDALLYAITLGAVTRLAIRRAPVRIPPFTGIVVAWVAVCVMQVSNPADGSTLHAIASLRQHLEFVPLFFFGYAVLRSPRRLEGFLLLLVVIAAVNGVVNLVQSHMTPQQLASWGPGYAATELGDGAIFARVFVSGGIAHVRPLGLGGADGFGGLVCMIAVPAVIALLSSRRSARFSWFVVPAVLCIIVGIVSSQTRLVVLTAVLAFVVFALLTLASRRGLIVLIVGFVLSAGAFWIGTAFISNNANRYSTIAPSHLVSTAVKARSNSLVIGPTYFVRYPLGAGLGSVGPAGGSSFGGGLVLQKLNGENQLNFLLVETGIPGLVVMIVLFAVVVRAGVKLRRVADPRLQRYLMALVAVVIGITVSWYDTPVTADSPYSPFFWLTSGCIAFWYQEMSEGRLPMRPRRVRNTLARR
jgi:hypothetical protein